MKVAYSVQNAGTAAVNGVYRLTPTYDGKPTYQHLSSGARIWWLRFAADLGFWIIGTTPGVAGAAVLYRAAGATGQAVPPEGTYATGAGGSAPAAYVLEYDIGQNPRSLPTMGLTTTAQPAVAVGNRSGLIYVQAKATNTGIVYAGDATRQTLELAAGTDRLFGPCSASELYLKSSEASGDEANIFLFSA